MPKLFTEEEIKELSEIFGLTPVSPPPVPEILPISDGNVSKQETVWWRYSGGPEQVKAGDHWHNIKEYPKLYSHKKPQVLRVEYSM